MIHYFKVKDEETFCSYFATNYVRNKLFFQSVLASSQAIDKCIINTKNTSNETIILVA